MKIQMMMVALMSATIAVAADKFPNQNLVTRYIGADTNETYAGVVNDGTVYKLGAGEVTLEAPFLNNAGDVKVADGSLKIVGGTVAATELPERLQKKAKIWLDAATHVVRSDSLVDVWYDCRETSLDVATAAYPYAKANVAMIAADTDGNERRPTYIAETTELGGKPSLDFGQSWTSTDTRWLRIQNVKKDDGTARNGNWIYAREAFAVFAKRPDNANEGKTTVFGAYFWNGSSNFQNPCWISHDGVLFYGSDTTRGDKCQLRMDGQSVFAGRYPIVDTNWHVMSARLPILDDECYINQLGLDRQYPQYSGGSRIAEVLLFEDRLSEVDRLCVETYLRRKWLGEPVAALGGLDVNSTATVEIDGTAGHARLSGAGAVVKSGDGRVTFADRGFSGTVELKSGPVRQDGRIAFAVKEGGQTLTATEEGLLARSSAGAGCVVKTGAAPLTVASVDPSVETLSVEDGLLRLAPQADAADDVVPVDFPNADFEQFSPLCKTADTYIYNFAASGGQCATNSNWVFDRSDYATGGALATVMFKTAYHAGSWKLQPEDDLGLGYDGLSMAYLYQGRISGFFTVAKAGRYRLSCRVSARGPEYKKPIHVSVDDQEVGAFSIFTCYEFKRWEIELSNLTAGQHKVTFGENGNSGSGTLVFDDVKVSPVRGPSDTEPIAVANGGFEEPLEQQTDANAYKATWKPSLAKVTGWTTKPQPLTEAFYSDSIFHTWFDGVTPASYATGQGLLTMPEDAADGFLFAQLYADGRFAQTVSLPSAGRYRLTFALARRPGLMPQTVVASVGGTVVKRVTVYNDFFRDYEAIFDVEEGGEKELSFAGTVTNDKEYLVGSAFIDKVALERLGDVPQGNLIANGGFENGSASWTLGGAAALVTAYANWPRKLTHSALQGNDGLVLGGSDGGASAVQTVVFEQAGRYELTFHRAEIVKYLDDLKYRGGLTISLGNECIYADRTVANDRERTVTVPFVVRTPGDYSLTFSATCNYSTQQALLVDDIAIMAAPKASASVIGVPASLNVEVANGAKLALDYDGRAQVGSVRLGGRKRSGVISAERFPEFISGRGELFVDPKGLMMIVR